ncbi:DUF3237 domain-containing protein [Nocardia altamirensis]|uniref:DUF3237 domain-containing protein n=1 Tax=Nocardia altamirensis TaxID=472158 RepID=UPI0009FB9C6D|nr:DUF3237 domain-containing protein [Nocardia altamirensis]
MTTHVTTATDARIREIGGLETTYLFDIAIDLKPPLDIGPGPLGNRMFWPVIGGTFNGPKLRGEVLPGGGDWSLAAADGSGRVDVRLTLRTHDDALIHVTYTGRLNGPADVRARLMDPTQAGAVDPASYYFRTSPQFETGSAKYSWLNQVVAVGSGYLIDGGVAYRVFQID